MHASSRNVFSLGRRRGDEDQLTEMLAWLVSAAPAVGHRLVELAFERELDIPETDLQTQVVIQGGRLDALIVAPAIAVVVESKLGSTYAEDQLRKYLEWLGSTHSDRDARALMTLTRDHAPWRHEDQWRAEELGIIAAPRRWEELHDFLAPLCDDSTDTSARLIREFLEMLSEEGLIPMQPLSEAELADAWRSSREVIRRYHDFFRACKSAIADALGAQLISGSASEHFDYTWQDFRLPDDTRVVIGIWFTDDGVPLKPPVYTHAPIVWMAVEGKNWPDWTASAAWLEAHPPAGWRPRGKRWWGRPEVWCYLSDAVGSGTFDEQCVNLAQQCGVGAGWIRDALQTSGASSAKT